jgi:hypothetical protein
MIATTARNATLPDLATMLRDQHARKLDVIAPASQLHADGGALIVRGSEPILGDDGVTSADGRYIPTEVFDEGVADKLRIPLAYVRRLRAERPDLWDANVNGWLHGRKPCVRPDGTVVREPVAGDSRSFLVRAFRGDDGEGIARALLSDRYGIMDNLDALTAALDGVRAAGVQVEIDGCDLTDRRMYVRLVAPEVQALAPDLLRGYRSPFTGNEGADNPTVFAGFVISNSETGGGAFTIIPRLVVQVCRNGMTISKDALRAVHLGGRQDDGMIRWSQDTHRKTAELITARTRDAVATFLDVEYMRGVIRGLEADAGKPLDHAADRIKTIGKTLSYSQDVIDGVLDHFIRGGQPTAGGVLQAVTSYAQTIGDADAAHDLEASAVRALALAAA